MNTVLTPDSPDEPEHDDNLVLVNGKPLIHAGEPAVATEGWAHLLQHELGITNAESSAELETLWGRLAEHDNVHSRQAGRFDLSGLDDFDTDDDDELPPAARHRLRDHAVAPRFREAHAIG